MDGQHDGADGQPDFDGVDTGGLGEAIDDGNQDDESDVEEDGNRQKESGGSQGRDDPAGPEQLRELAGQRLCAAGNLDHLAQHGAEAHQDGHGAEGSTHAFRDGFDDIRQRDSCDQRHGNADHEQGEECGNFELDNCHEQQGDARRCYGQKS